MSHEEIAEEHNGDDVAFSDVANKRAPSKSHAGIADEQNWTTEAVEELMATLTEKGKQIMRVMRRAGDTLSREQLSERVGTPERLLGAPVAAIVRAAESEFENYPTPISWEPYGDDSLALRVDAGFFDALQSATIPNRRGRKGR